MQRACLLATLALASVPAAQPSLAGPRLFPRGARAAGVPDVRFDSQTSAYLLTLRDLAGATLVEYRVPLRHPNLTRGVLRVEETSTGVVPIAAGGLFYRTAVPAPGTFGSLITPFDLAFTLPHDPLHNGGILSHGLDASGAVTLRLFDDYTTPAGTVHTEKTYVLRLRGRSLEIQASGDEQLRLRADYDYAGFHFGDGEGLPAAGQALHVPYLDMIPVFVAGPVRVARYLDWYASNASDTLGYLPAVTGARFAGETSSAYYANDAQEVNAPIREVAWVTVSGAIDDLFPVIDRPPSEYRLHCASRAVSQNAPGNSYAAAAGWVKRAAGLGMDGMSHIKWDWSKWPFNLNDPDHLPAPPAAPVGTIWGTVADWTSFMSLCAQADWTLALYMSQDMMDPGYPALTLQLPGSLPGSVLLTPNPAYERRSACAMPRVP